MFSNFLLLHIDCYFLLSLIYASKIELDQCALNFLINSFNDRFFSSLQFSLSSLLYFIPFLFSHYHFLHNSLLLNTFNFFPGIFLAQISIFYSFILFYLLFAFFNLKHTFISSMLHFAHIHCLILCFRLLDAHKKLISKVYYMQIFRYWSV
jgi:hypothetical protein